MNRFVQNYIKYENCLLCETDNFEGYDSLIEMNRDINDSEVKSHIDKAKNAHGVDGILNEPIKASKNMILPLLTKLFNMIFNGGLFPTSWGIGIIVSIFKSGIKINPGNYRGISLLSNLSKIFTSNYKSKDCAVIRAGKDYWSLPSRFSTREKYD